MSEVPHLAVAAVGLVAGRLSGLFGVGGGIVIVPLLVMVAGFSQHRAHATSLGDHPSDRRGRCRTFAVDGRVDPNVAAALAAGSLLGAHLGARLMIRVPEGWLKVTFGSLMIATGTLLLWR